MQFEWDPTKAQRNETKHGVSFLEASTIFDDDYSSTVIDPDHLKARPDTSRLARQVLEARWW